MKVITIFIHTNIQQPLTQFLRASDMVSGFSLSHVEGHGIEKDNDPFVLAHDEAIGSIPRLRVELYIQDDKVKPFLQSLRDSNLKLTGQSFYWVTDATEGGHL